MHTGHLRGALFSTFLKSQPVNQINKFIKSLQAYGKPLYVISHFLHRTDVSLKRASLRWSVKVRAMVSVEAAIAIPIFLFAFLEVLSLFQCLSVYSQKLYEIRATALPMSMYAHSLDSEWEQFSYYDSKLEIADNILIVDDQYYISPIIPFGDISIPMQNFYFLRLWTGYDAAYGKHMGGYVYITKTGGVYHTYRDCTHLVLSISSVKKDELQKAHNDDGEGYTRCPMCMVGMQEGANTFYITRTGNKYHGDLNCTALKRTVICITMEEVQDRELCMRCAQRRDG